MVDKAVQHARQEDLDHGGGHPTGHVTHLLQVLFICVVLPLLVLLHHPDLLLHQVGLDIVEDLQTVEGVPLEVHHVDISDQF